jgi:putative transport protein
VHWFGDALRSNPSLALFLSLALGYFVGSLRLGRFQLSPMIGTLLAGIAVGQFAIPIPAPMKNVFFLFFVFAMGFRTGPEFFRSLRSNAIPQLALILLLNITGFGITWSIMRTAKLDNATAAGLFSGAMTNSTALGAAASAAEGLNVDAESRAAVAHKVATTYALTYVVGILLVVWFLPSVGPLLMRVSLRDASHKFDQTTSDPKPLPVNSAYTGFVVRAYRLPPALHDRTVDEVEHLWPSDQRVIIVRIRRADTLLDANPAMGLHTGDVVAVAGRSNALVSNANPLTVEVDDRDLLAMPTTSGEIVLTNRNLARQTLRTIANNLGARGIFVTGLKRAGRELPFNPTTIIESGDVMSVSGTRSEVARVAAEVGYVEYPTSSTDLFLVAATIVVGGFVGLPAVVISGFALSLTVPVGVLLAGLVLGYLRSLNPRFGRIPIASVLLFESLGLAAFLALVGLEAGAEILGTFRNLGFVILAAVTAIALVPHIVTILLGYYVFRLNPAILLGLCAGAGTSAPGLAALEKVADSKVPTLGYGLAYATGNILTAIGATLFVLMT